MSADNNQLMYLKPNVQMEPLISNWPAWPHLIPPATSAMNTAFLHLKVLKSFIMAPDLHASTLKDPTMQGGLFLNIDPSRVGEVRAFMDRTLTEQSSLIKLGEAIKSLNEMLINEAKGYSLEGMYQKVPAILKGYVELVYDLNNFPSARFIEALLYQSPYYDLSRQAMHLTTVNSDNRPFLYMTPRFEDSESVQIKIPFCREGVDDLFRMRHTPKTFDSIKQSLELSDDYDNKFRSLLTSDPPR